MNELGIANLLSALTCYCAGCVLVALGSVVYIGNGQTRKSFLLMLTFIFCFVTFSCFFSPLSHILCNDVMFNDERNRLQPDVASASNSFGRDLKNAKESREIIIKKKSQNR